MPVLIPAKKLHSEERLVYLNAQASRRFATSIFSLRYRDQSSNPLKQRQTSVRTTLSSHISLNPAIGVVQMTIYLDQYFTLNLQLGTSIATNHVLLERKQAYYFLLSV